MDLRNVINWEIPEGVVVKVMDSNGIVIWDKGNSEPDNPIANEIYYTSTNGNIIELSSDYSGVQPISNTYENGVGKMVFENNLTEIGNSAFYNCSSLQSIVIPSTLKTIGNTAFYNCSSLQSIVIPSTLKTIGNRAFQNCSSLQSIVIPEGVTSIYTYAFSGCSSLQSIVIPEGVTTINMYAFHNCSSLQSIELPSSVKTIDYSAFQNCSSLQSIVISEGMTTIKDSVFFGCHSLYSITCKAMTAPTITHTTFVYTSQNVQSKKILYVPQGSNGYETWLEQLEGFKLQYITE